jgi:F-type H+-transporting ATPase subunit b
MFDEKFWVGVSFAILIALLYRPIARILTKGLDDRSKRIQEELERAVQLREEAQAILASYQRKQQEALEEAGEIVAQAKASANYMMEKAREDLEEALNRRVEVAMQKIAQHEAAVMQELKQNTVNLALGAVRQVLADDTGKESMDETVRQSIEEVKRNLH